MTHNEKRAIRREWINYYLHKGYKSSVVKMFTRIEEKTRYGKELKAYAGRGQ